MFLLQTYVIDIYGGDLHQEDEPRNDFDEDNHQNVEQMAHGDQPQSPGTRQFVREPRPPTWLTSGD